MNSRYVRGEGNPNAELMVVGEAPGFYENEAGRPFVGPSGHLVDEFLKEAGLDRSEVFCDNVLKYRPPENKFERYKELGINLQEQIDELYATIREVNPKCILALGAQALRALTGRHGKNNSITENRGSILRLTGKAGLDCKVVSSFHPAKLLHEKGSDNGYDPRMEMVIKFDFKRAVEESRSRDYNIPQRHLWIARNSLDVWRFIDRNKHRRRVAVDIEVINAIPICIGLAFDSFEAMSVPILDFSSAFHTGRLCTTARDVAESIVTIARLLARKDLEVVAQNGKFDFSKLRNLYIYVLGKIVDIMLIHHSLYPEWPKSLEFQTSMHTREPFYKAEGYEFNFKTDRLENYLLYNARDAAVELEIADVLVPDLAEFGLHDFYFGFPQTDWRHPFSIQALHQMYMEMEDVGFLYDPKANKELRKKYGDWIKKIQHRLDTLSGGHVNVNSSPQVTYLLYEHLKLPKRAGADEDTLVALMNSPVVKDEAKKQIIADILTIRRLRRNESAYLKAKPDFDGRMRTVYKIAGTETGRTATQKQNPPTRPNVKDSPGFGLSFHQITKHGEIGPDIRKEFPVDKGYVYIQADAKQAEARVVFLLAKLYDRLIQMEDPNYDIHSITGSWFYAGETPEEIRKQKDKRFTGKEIRHAGHLGMGKNRCMHLFNTNSKRLGIDAQISEWRADQYLKTFHANDPAIQNVFQEEVFDAVKSTRILVSPHGRRREFFGDLNDMHTLKEGLAFIPQATIADNTKRAMLAIRESIHEIRFVLEWHDGFLALVPETEVEDYGRIFVREMEKPIDFSLCTLPRGKLVIPCELEISDTNYYELKPFELKSAA